MPELSASSPRLSRLIRPYGTLRIQRRLPGAGRHPCKDTNLPFSLQGSHAFSPVETVGLIGMSP